MLKRVMLYLPLFSQYDMVPCSEGTPVCLDHSVTVQL